MPFPSGLPLRGLPLQYGAEIADFYYIQPRRISRQSLSMERAAMVEVDRSKPITSLFLPVRLCTLRVGDILGFELYLRRETPNAVKYILYKGRRTPFSDLKRSFLIENGIDTLYVRQSDSEVYWKYVSENIEDLLSTPEITVDEKSRIIYEASSTVVERLFAEPTSRVHIERSQKLVESTVEYLTSDQWNFHNLIRIFSYDYTLYTHSVNVSAMGIALAHHIGITDRNELHSIGHGLLLHDIGKSKIPHSIINKRGMLNSVEMAEIRRHPLHGLELIKTNPRVNNLAREIILHHHEKINGAGYPHGLRGTEVTLPTRIAALVDIFDALTTRRPYRKALRAYSALRLMRDDMNQELDFSLFRALLAILAPHPRSTVSVA
jgi:HD-GYP domain-containing protein (c-di-GMP phosphodiesterase class II)